MKKIIQISTVFDPKYGSQVFGLDDDGSTYILDYDRGMDIFNGEWILITGSELKD